MYSHIDIDIGESIESQLAQQKLSKNTMMNNQRNAEHVTNEINKSLNAKKGYFACCGWSLQVEFEILTIMTYPFLFSIFTLIDYSDITPPKMIAIFIISLLIIAHVIVDGFGLIGIRKRDRKYLNAARLSAVYQLIYVIAGIYIIISYFFRKDASSTDCIHVVMFLVLLLSSMAKVNDINRAISAISLIEDINKDFIAMEIAQTEMDAF